MKRILRAFLAGLLVLLMLASPVLAIINPADVQFYAVGSVPVYKAFYNVIEDGDRLFAAEQFVHYAVAPNETASEAFLFEVLNIGANTTIASVPLNQYEAKPISIYMTATQVTAANATNTMDVGTALILRITGNPLLFTSTTNNTANVTLDALAYVDQELGDDGGVATNNNLRNFLIGMAEDIEDYDSPPVGSEYITTVSGVKYLTTTGGAIFLEGIPALDAMCPILFQYAVSPMQGDEPQSTGAYTSVLTPLNLWGQTVANGLTNLGLYLGLSQALAGSAVLLMLVVGLAIYSYTKTQSGVATILLIATAPFLGAWFGLMPLALAFIFTIVVVVLLGYFFLSRGAL